MRPTLVCLLLLVSTCLYGQPSRSGFTLIRAGRFYDGQSAGFLNNQEILIQGDVIRAVGPKLNVPKGAKILDLRHCTVTPGLIDAHTHLLFDQRAQTNQSFVDASKIPDDERLKQGLDVARQNLQSGITTVRDLGNSGQFLDLQLQQLLATNPTLGPRLYASGPILSPPGGQFSKLAPADSFVINQEYRVIRGAADARAAVLEHAKRGVNVIKVCMNTDNRVLAPDEIKAIVQMSHANKLPVTAHATYDDSARDAVLAGVDGIEHCYGLSDSTLLLMAARKVYAVPTYISRKRGKIMVDGTGLRGKDADDYLTTALTGYHSILRNAIKKNVMIVAGSDHYISVGGIKRGEGAVDVLLSYYEAGVPVHDVIRFGTFNAAKALGISDRYGCIKKGAKANLVAFDGDLETNFPNSLFAVKAVVHEGQLVHQVP